MTAQTRNKKDKTLWIPLEEEADDTTSNDELEVMNIDDYDSLDGSEEDKYEEEEEDEDNDEEEESKTKDWGNKKEDFYDGGSSSTESEGDNWSDVEMQDEEARGIQASRMMRLSNEDFGMEDIVDQEGFDEADDGLVENGKGLFGISINDAEELLESLSSLSNTRQSGESGVSVALDKEEGLESLNSELAPLLASMKEKVTEVKERMQVLLDLVKTKEGKGLVTKNGMEYLDSKNNLLLMYIGYLCYYMMLKTSPNVNIKEHPILLRLVTLRTMMEKLKPIDVKLQPQIDRILELAEKSSQVDSFLSSAPRPDRFVFENDDDNDFEGDDVASRHDDMEDDFESANINSDVDTTGSDGDMEGKGCAIYKVPKNIPVEFNDKKLSKTEKMMKELERERQRLLRTDIIRQMRSSIKEGPDEVGREDAENLPQLERLQRQIKERIDFEEDNMMRLPKSKKDKREERLYKRLMSQVEGGVNTLDDLAQFAERAADMATDSKKNSLAKYLNNASRLSKEITRSNLAQQNSDKSITEKLVKRRKAQAELSQRSRYRPEYDSGDLGHDESVDESYAVAEKELFENNSYLREVLKFNEEKMASKQKRKQEIDGRNMPNIDDLVDSGSRRASTKEMIKNKGLTRKRKKIEGNARVHNRLKYKKALKRLKGSQRSMRDYEGNYSGESTGLKDNVKRSTNLN